MINLFICLCICLHRAQWLRGRASDSRLRGSRFKSGAAVLKPWASVSTLHCSSSIRCMNEYLVIDIGAYLFTNSLRALIAGWLSGSERRRDDVPLNMFVKE